MVIGWWPNRSRYSAQNSMYHQTQKWVVTCMYPSKEYLVPTLPSSMVRWLQVSELKAELWNRALSTIGRKAELVRIWTYWQGFCIELVALIILQFYYLLGFNFIFQNLFTYIYNNNHSCRSHDCYRTMDWWQQKKSCPMMQLSVVIDIIWCWW